MSEKIQSSHIERDAYVYIRQSSMQQVRTRLEGQRRQYDLRERALEHGFQRVVIIDEDLGRSGTGSVERPGFGRLLEAVCSGKVGAVLALEASRLARNNRDWHHLIDLCAMAGTLVIDHDGIYDPSLLNDRLLLGLKGTMSEFEISLLRQRAMEARRQKVGRGLVLTQVPVGYVRTEDEGIEKTPDRQVQEAIADIFRKFRELGSVRQVLLWYRDEKLLIPTLSRESGHRKLVWIEPVYPRIFGILKNPTYAGVFVWGRNHTRTAIVDGRARKTDPRQRRLECTHGECEWRSEKRFRIAGRVIALRSLRTRTSGLLRPQQTTWLVAALLVRWRSRSADGSQLHYLRGHTRGPVSCHRSPRSHALAGCACRD
jgi:DNA invertase Pin-like site-specific DNA recombinase